MKIAVIGGNGQLGADVIAEFRKDGHEVRSLNHAEIELSEAGSVSRAIRQVCPDIIVNTAAMHHVENCELDPLRAFEVNGIGSRNLAQIAQELDAILVHISTDYVFDGSKRSPYVEEDAPRPLNSYGNTKLAGEYFVRSTVAKHFVLRTSAIYGKYPCRAKGGLNFVDLMLKLARERGRVRVVDDEFVTPTRTTEIARQIIVLCQSNAFGLYHATAEGSCSWYQFAREIFRLSKVEVTLEKASPGEFPAKVQRPTFSVLENAALKAQNLNVFTPWQIGLHEYLGLSSPQ